MSDNILVSRFFLSHQKQGIVLDKLSSKIRITVWISNSPNGLLLSAKNVHLGTVPQSVSHIRYLLLLSTGLYLSYRGYLPQIMSSICGWHFYPNPFLDENRAISIVRGTA